MKKLTSLDRKSRAVNAQDIASQLKMKDKTPLKSLKSKNSELLAKYREKLKGNSDTENSSEVLQEESEQEIEQDSDKKLIPKVSESFQGVVFDEEVDSSDEIEPKNKKRSGKKKSWNKNNHRDSSKGNDDNKSRFKKFKPFNRSQNSKGKQSSQKKQRF